MIKLTGVMTEQKQTQTQADLPQLNFNELLSAKQIAAHFGVNEDTVLRWWHEGLPTGDEIPRALRRRRGFRDYLFERQVVAFIQEAINRLD